MNALAKTAAKTDSSSQKFSSAHRGMLQRKCACGGSPGVSGECEECQDKRLQRKLTIGASNDPLEQEADRVAESIVDRSRPIQLGTLPSTDRVVQRQPDDTQKPREQPTTFPVEEQPKHGKEKEDEEKDKLKTGALKAAGEIAKLWWDGFSTSETGKHILAQNEHDWRNVIKFFKDFADTAAGKIVLGSVSGAAATGAFLGARSARDQNQVADPFSAGTFQSRAPKDEKFIALELKWDFISPPASVTLKTPWLDSPEIGGGSKSNKPATLAPPPKFIAPIQKIPNICTPADPQGDNGEAAARSAQIYSWLLWREQQDAKKLNDLLHSYAGPIGGSFEIWRPGQPYTFKPNQVSPIKPLFKRADGTAEIADPQAVLTGLHSSAGPLDPATRADMEMRFGHDFSRVRVHTDAKAAESARAVNALAYTVGRDVVFGAGQYAPGTREGRRLLAHELTHVVQQFGSSGQAAAKSNRQITLGEPHDSFEHEADHVANEVTQPGMGGRQQQVRGPSLHSQPWKLMRQEARPPSEQELKAEARLRRLASRPGEALTEWRRLKDAERSFVIMVMIGRYGFEFAQDFQRYATGKKKPNIVLTITNSRSDQPKELIKRGFRHTVDNVWVHPSGREVWVYPPGVKAAQPAPQPEDEHAKQEKCQATCNDVDDEDECYKCCEDKIPAGESKCRTQCKVTCATKL